MILFRKNALNKISSAEELDKAIVIVGTKSWLMLLTITVMAVLFVLWSIFARVASHIEAPGIFLPYDGIIVNIKSTNPGKLERIYVSVGDIIEKNGLVAQLSANESRRRLEAAQEKLASEQALYDRIASDIEARTARRNTIRQEQFARMDEQIAFLELEIETNRAVLDRTLAAYQDRNATQAALTAARNTYFQSRQRLDGLLSNREEQIYTDVQTTQQDNVRLEQTKQSVQTLENSVRDLENELARTEIYSPISGRIIEIKNIPGSDILPNQTVANLVSSQSQYYAQAEKNLEFVSYVSIANGSKIGIGNEVNVAVSGFEKTKYGFIRGVVTDVSDFTVSEAGILSKLGNRNLVSDFTRQGSVYEVTVRLLQSSESKNRLLWSTDRGNEIENIDIGTLGQAEFVLDKARPISRAIPALERILN